MRHQGVPAARVLRALAAVGLLPLALGCGGPGLFDGPASYTWSLPVTNLGIRGPVGPSLDCDVSGEPNALGLVSFGYQLQNLGGAPEPWVDLPVAIAPGQTVVLGPFTTANRPPDAVFTLYRATFQGDVPATRICPAVGHSDVQVRAP